MSWGLRGLLSCILVIGLLIPNQALAQIDLEDSSTRIWSFVSQDDELSREFLMIFALEFESRDDGVEKVRNAISGGFLDDFMDSPEVQENHELGRWCYLYEGGAGPYDPTLEGAWLYACPVGSAFYMIFMYGNDMQPAIEVAEDLVLYNVPTVPSGWIDISNEVGSGQSGDDSSVVDGTSHSENNADSGTVPVTIEAWNFQHQSRPTRSVVIMRAESVDGSSLRERVVQGNDLVAANFLFKPRDVSKDRVDSRLGECFIHEGLDKFSATETPSVLIDCPWNEYQVTILGVDMPYRHVESIALSMLGGESAPRVPSDFELVFEGYLQGLSQKISVRWQYLSGAREVFF